MKADEIFIEKVKAYFSEVEFREVDISRIKSFLREYKESLPTNPMVVIKEKIEYVNVSGLKLPVTQNKLDELGMELCNKWGTRFDLFSNKIKKRAKEPTVQARKEFCKIAIQKFDINQEMLRAYFNLDHSSISYYLNGKKVRKQILKQTA